MRIAGHSYLPAPANTHPTKNSSLYQTMNTPYEILSRADLRAMIDRGDAMTLIEVLPEDNYRNYHLPGAINIPGDQLRETIPGTVSDKESTVVVYCANPSCAASDRAAQLLTDMGYRNVFDYRGGKEHWKEGGLPVEQTAPETETVEA